MRFGVQFIGIEKKNCLNFYEPISSQQNVLFWYRDRIGCVLESLGAIFQASFLSKHLNHYAKALLHKITSVGPKNFIP